MFTKRILPFLGAVVTALILVIIFINLYPKDSHAYAEELIQKSLVKVNQLSPSQKAVVEQKIHSNLQTSLKEAKAAKDLRILTSEELKERSNQLEVMVVKYSENETFFEYTNSQGAQVLLGLDENQIPFVKITSTINKYGNGVSGSVESNGTGAGSVEFKVNPPTNDQPGSSQTENNHQIAPRSGSEQL
ncbi:hypothetical protein HZA75_07055 [Candidatus Roizmanbacteria bacterium]|nr:hypothetical protein [Candidatus Roizmanbacteria bacterium]